MPLAGLLVLAQVAATPTPVTLSVNVDAQLRTLDLGAGRDSFLSPQLLASPSPTGVRLIPALLGSRIPARWILRVEHRAADGTLIRDLSKAAQAGRGQPPLYVDLALPPIRGGAYVATLEVRDSPDGDTAMAAPVVLPAPGLARPVGRRIWLGRIRADAMDEDLAALTPIVLEHLAVTGVRVVLQGHWEPADDADARAEGLAKEVLAKLVARGLSPQRLKVQTQGASQLRFATLTPTLRKRNRRVELIRQPPRAAPAPSTSLPEPGPRRLELTVDGRMAAVPLNDTATRSFSVDLDPPAKLQAELHDGRGGWSRLRRGLDHRAQTSRVRRVAPQAGLPNDVVQIVSGEVVLTEEGPRLDLELRAPDGVRSWLLVVYTPQTGEVWAHEGGAGCPPPRISLVGTASSAPGLAKVAELRVQLDEEHRVQTPSLSVPALSAEPQEAHAGVGEDVGSAFLPLIDTLVMRASARLLVVVHGGSRTLRTQAQRRLQSLMATRGLAAQRLQWSAGRADGGLVLQGHIVESVPLLLKPPAETQP